ncbi:Tol-Pal system protein TolB [Bienertia sinuspersici]
MNFNRDDEEILGHEHVPGIILPHITAFKDVVADGNCGFRVVADAFQGSEQNWGQVRHFLANEIRSHSLYSRIYGGPEFVDAALQYITWTGGRCGEEHWMEVSTDLFAIANCYKCIIFFFGYGLCRPRVDVTPCHASFWDIDGSTGARCILWGIMIIVD